MEEDKKNAICRVCLKCDFQKEPGKSLSLFEEYNDCVISDKINALTDVGIEKGDGLPDRICPTCLLELESAFKFKLKCENSNKVLLYSVNNSPAPLDVSDDVTDHVKEEYFEEDNIEYDEEDDNISLSKFTAAAAATALNNVPTFKSFDDAVSLKEEYLDDNKDDISLADLQAAGNNTETPPKPSRAKDLKLECHDCGGFFKSKCKLRVHWKKVHMTEKLKCTNCFRKFKSYAAYNTHMKQKSKSCATASKVRIEGEGKNRIFHCKDCNYQSLRVKDMSAHIVRHTGERPFQCDICLRTFTQQSSLTSHKEGTHKVYTAEGTCHYCGKHIQGRTKLYRHLEQHRYDSFPCKVCYLVLKTRNSLRNHMRRHSGVKAYICEVCPISFFTASELNNHKNKVHLKTKIYRCELCNYRSLSYSVMSRHRPKHSDANVSCDVCGAFSDNEMQLALHKKRHTDRNFPCSHCEKTYFTRKNLNSHIRAKHSITKLGGSRAEPTSNANSVKSEYSIEIVPLVSLSLNKVQASANVSIK